MTIGVSEGFLCAQNSQQIIRPGISNAETVITALVGYGPWHSSDCEICAGAITLERDLGEYLCLSIIPIYANIPIHPFFRVRQWNIVRPSVEERQYVVHRFF